MWQIVDMGMVNVIFMTTSMFEGDNKPFPKDSLISHIVITNKALMENANRHPRFLLLS